MTFSDVLRAITGVGLAYRGTVQLRNDVSCEGLTASSVALDLPLGCPPGQYLALSPTYTPGYRLLPPGLAFFRSLPQILLAADQSQY